jgi:hypothetical protein
MPVPNFPPFPSFKALPRIDVDDVTLEVLSRLVMRYQTEPELLAASIENMTLFSELISRIMHPA